MFGLDPAGTLPSLRRMRREDAARAAALAATILCVTPARAADRVIAPFPIEDATGRLSDGALDGLNEYLAGRLATAKGVSIVPRKDIKAQLSRQKEESFKECYDQSCQIEIGKELAATHVLTSRITSVGSQCILTSFMYTLRTATTESASTVRTTCDADAMVEAVDRLVAELLGGAVATRPPPPKVAKVTPPPPPPPDPAKVTPAPPPPPKRKKTVSKKKKKDVAFKYPDPPAPRGDGAGVSTEAIVWLSAGAALAAGGVVVDTVPGSSSNGDLDAVDFVPVGLYALGAVAVVLGIAELVD